MQQEEQEVFERQLLGKTQKKGEDKETWARKEDFLLSKQGICK